MNTIQEYDQHLQDFYAASFRDYALKHDHPEKAESFANKSLKAYGEAINEGIAFELLNNLHIKVPNNLDKLSKYPKMFWGTATGSDMLAQMSREVIGTYNSELYQKSNINLLDLEEVYNNIMVYAKAICLKNPLLGGKLLSNYDLDFTNMITQKIESMDGSELDLSQLSKDYSEVIIKLSEKAENKIEAPAFYVLRSHLNGLATREKYNPVLLTLKEPKLSKKM